MEKKMGIALVAALISTLIAGFAWVTIPVDFSGVGIEPTIKAMDEQGNIQTLTPGQLTTITWPTVAKIQIGATATVDLIGMASTDVQWWCDYQYKVKSQTSGKSGTYDAWEGGWSTDSGWAPYWKAWFSIQSGGTFDFEPDKKAWWYINHWEYRYSDGWMVLDPNTYDSVGDWIKWSGGLGETPTGNYDVTVDFHVKVNYKDNAAKEKTAIGPPGKGGANGELLGFLTFVLYYEAGSAKVTVTPKLGHTWIPLDVSGESPDYVKGIASALNTSGLPTWTLHAIFTPIAAISWIAAIYYWRKK